MKCLVVLLLVAVASTFAQDAPPFLAGAPPAKLKEFHEILIKHHEKTDDAMHAEVLAWIKKQSPEIQKKYADFEKEADKAQKAGDVAHAAAIANFSPAAKEADRKLSEIANSKTLTVKAKGEQMDAFIKSLPKAVHDEIVKAMQG